jgi:hypothetical protein
MAHTNQTPNYALSQFLGTDKPAWLVDYNGDMEKVDLGLKAAKDVADAAKAEADQGAIDIDAVTVTANAAASRSLAAISNFAEAYDATSTYDVGDYVVYENLLYECTTTITVPEAFDGTHWSRVTVDSVATGLLGNINLINAALNVVRDSITDIVSPVQINGATAFDSKFHVLYDWTSWLNIPGMAQYRLIIKLPAPDARYHNLIVFDAAGGVFICRANATNSIITLVRSI